MKHSAKAHARSARNRQSAMRLALVVLAMFGFGYALVPLYDVLCDITGLDGRTGVVQAAAVVEEPDTSRLITVELVGTVNSTLRWEFRPITPKLKVHPGKLYSTRFYAKNLADETVVGQAIPNVSPNTASRYFNKTECFCFTQQTFAAGEGRDMPVTFVIDKNLPQDVHTVTLSYTFFKAPPSDT